MKKTYLQPTMMVVRLQQQSIICSSPVTVSDVNSGDTDITLGGAGSGPARVRSYGGIDWDNDW